MKKVLQDEYILVLKEQALDIGPKRGERKGQGLRWS